jgi:hypothetical protein
LGLRRTLLDQAGKMRIPMRDQDMPWDLRIKAKSVLDKIELALGLRAALGRTMGSQAAADALLASLPEPEEKAPTRR